VPAPRRRLMLACAQHQTSENCQLVAAVANLIENGGWAGLAIGHLFLRLGERVGSHLAVTP
jgi:hypothetical protein